MARTHKPVNRTLLETCLSDAESQGALANRQILYASVAERYNIAIGIGNPKGWIAPSIVLLRIQEWHLNVLTPKGQRGRPKGTKLPPKLDAEGNVIPRKRKGRKATAANMQAMRNGEFSGSQYDGLMARIEQGSIVARVKANCLACAGFVREEVKHCQCIACPLWDIRPYQQNIGAAAAAAVDTVDDSSTLDNMPETVTA